MGFFLEIKNIWQKSRDFWFADFFLEIFKKAGMDIPMDFGCFESVSTRYIKNIYIKRATSKIWTKVKKVNKHMPHPNPKKSIV